MKLLLTDKLVLTGTLTLPVAARLGLEVTRMLVVLVVLVVVVAVGVARETKMDTGIVRFH